MLIYSVINGSKLYGTNTKNSDIDITKIFLEHKDIIYGILDETNFPQIEENETDIRKFFLKRFQRLCCAGNPNVFELLFAKTEHIVYIDKTFQELILFKNNFYWNGKGLINSHLGFAQSQIEKLNKHEKTIGAKRKELIKSYGYDVKYASHSIRLLLQLQELIKYKHISFPYEENIRELLVSIKCGDFTLEKFFKLYEFINKETKDIINKNQSFLEQRPNYKEIAKINETIFHELWRQI